MGSEQNQEYSLCFDNHKKMFTKNFTDFLIKKAFVDVTLVCQGEEMAAHQIMLAAFSPLFERLLIGKNQSHQRFIFVDISKYEMLKILEFIYKGTVNVSKNSLPALLKVAKMLEIQDLEYAILRRTGPKLEERNNLPVRHRFSEKSLTQNRSDADTILSVNERVPALSITPIVEPRRDRNLKVLNPFAKRRQYVEDSDTTFCEDDLMKAGPSKSFSPPSIQYDSDIEIVDNNPVYVINESQPQLVVDNNSPEWYRKTQLKSRKRVKEKEPETTAITYSSDDSEIASSFPKKSKKSTITCSDEDVEEQDAENLDTRKKNEQSALDKQKKILELPASTNQQRALDKQKKILELPVSTSQQRALDKQKKILELPFSKRGRYCVVCKKTKRDIRFHVKKTHCVPPRGKKFACKICSKAFYFEFSLKLHKCTPT